MKYYNPTKVLNKKCIYTVVFGERSNGKTYAFLYKGLKDYFESGKVKQLAYIRRWKEDVIGKRASKIFNGINENNVVRELSNGEYDTVIYRNGSLFVAKIGEDNKPIYNPMTDCLGYLFALSDTEHDKSTTYPNVVNIVFDEFLTRNVYLPDEFVTFMNTISTIVRDRGDVNIFMLGNTVNRFSPYFQEMGLKHVKAMEQGTIDVYKYGDSTLSVAVEYCSSSNIKKKSNKYFAFDNPKLEMITGGAWELSIYPHLPIKYKPQDILFTYFIQFNSSTYQCEIIEKDNLFFTYIHEKTTPIKNEDDDLIYSFDYVPKLNYNRNILKPINKLQQRITWFIVNDRVFYQNNEVGDSIKNYLKNCGRN